MNKIPKEEEIVRILQDPNRVKEQNQLFELVVVKLEKPVFKLIQKHYLPLSDLRFLIGYSLLVAADNVEKGKYKKELQNKETGETKFIPYVFIICRNTLKTLREEQGRFTSTDKKIFENNIHHSNYNDIIQDEEHKRRVVTLHYTLNALKLVYPIGYWVIIRLFFQGHDYEEVAREIDRTTDAVKAIRRRALNKMKIIFPTINL